VDCAVPISAVGNGWAGVCTLPPALTDQQTGVKLQRGPSRSSEHASQICPDEYSLEVSISNGANAFTASGLKAHTPEKA